MFILLKDYKIDSLDFDEIKQAYKKYDEYLADNKKHFPESAYSFATASWRGNNNDPRELHDSWLDTITIKESKKEGIEIIIKLVGAFHDRHLNLRYLNVDKYIIKNNSHHGDLLRNEIRLSDDMKVVHEIEWGIDENWIIECEDITYNYTLF